MMAESKPGMQALAQTMGTEFPDGAFAEQQVQDKAEVGEDGCKQNPSNSRSGRMPSEHYPEGYACNNEQLKKRGGDSPE